MTFWRKLGVVGLCLSLIEGVVDVLDPDGAVGTTAEIAMMTTMLGLSGEKPRARQDQQDPADALSLLTR